MRVKKQKRHRRAVRFYTACFGFRQPFKVLCDGPFLSHLFANTISPADKALSNVLGGPVKVFTTSCVIAELKRISDENRKKGKEKGEEDPFVESLKFARKIAIARCDHEKAVQGADCMIKIIGETNSDHFFVATQPAPDDALRKHFRQIPGVPLLYGHKNAILIEPPSTFQRQFVQTSEQQRLHMTEREFVILKKKVKEGSGTDEVLADELGGAIEPTKYVKKRSDYEKDRPQFKRNRAKGPNPLSCKKKKVKVQSNAASAKEGNDEETVRSRSRKRKRSRGGKSGAVTDNP